MTCFFSSNIYYCFIYGKTVIGYPTLTQTISTNFTSINIIDLELINYMISHIEKRATHETAQVRNFEEIFSATQGANPATLQVAPF